MKISELEKCLTKLEMKIPELEFRKLVGNEMVCARMVRFGQLMRLKILKILYALGFFLWIVSSKAQDTITFKNGNRIVVKVLSVSDGQIHYSKIENPDSPIYNRFLTEIKSVKYADGKIFHPVRSILPPKKEQIIPLPVLEKTKRKGLAMMIAGSVIMSGGLALMSYGIDRYIKNEKYANTGYYNPLPSIATYMGGIVIISSSSPLLIVGAVKFNKAKKAIYRMKNPSTSMSLSPVLMPDINHGGFRAGIGIALNF